MRVTHLEEYSLNANSNASHNIVCVNTYWQYIIDKLFVMRYLTPYIYNDILGICHTKKQNRSQCSIAIGVGIVGNNATLIKNQLRAQSVKVPIGTSRGHELNQQKKSHKEDT